MEGDSGADPYAWLTPAEAARARGLGEPAAFIVQKAAQRIEELSAAKDEAEAAAADAAANSGAYSSRVM